MSIFRSNDPHYQARLDYSHAIHTLSSPAFFGKLNVFEQRFLKNVTKYTDKELFPSAPHEIRLRLHNVFATYVGFNDKPKDDVRK
jgi:hypothetical protein